MPDPVVRNLWITQRYHELAVALRDRGAAPDATWCAFAVWASKTAGSVIRQEALPAASRLLAARPAAGVGRFNAEGGRRGWLRETVEHHHLARIVERVSAQVAGYIAQGNALVFAELAPAFEMLARTWPAAAPDTVIAAVRGVLPAGAAGAALGRAFEFYARAGTASPVDRAALFLAGNVVAVAHEQQKLQPAIAASLDAGVDDALHDLLRHHVHPGAAGAASLLDSLVGDVVEAVRHAWEEALTATMLRLVTYDEHLDLRHDVPPLAGTLWPPELAMLEASDVAATVAAWDRTGGRGSPTGAHDWTRLEERMNFILWLFRSRQRHPPLLQPPFRADQLSDLGAGKLPSAPL
jgi:hypothetical protein